MAELNLVIAHTLEAKPLIAWFDLHQVSKDPAVYAGSNINLIISGQGQHWAREAVAWLAQHQESAAIPAWLNIGIAGHRSLSVGEPLLANKIVDRASGETVYPAPSLAFKQVGELHTVDEPELDYPANVAYDMEAFGFFQAASALTTLELVQSLKIISDNPGHSTEKITRDKVLGLFESNSEVIQTVVADLDSLTARYNDSLLNTPEFAQIAAQVHLTATQQVQVQRLCQRYYAFGMQQHLAELLTPASLATGDARQLVRRLQEPLAGME